MSVEAGIFRIGDLVKIAGGGTPKKSVAKYYGGDIPWVTPKDMKSWYVDGAKINITEAGLKESTARLVPAGSVLVVVRSGVLKHSLPIAITSRPVALNQDMKALVCSELIEPRYLARLIQAESSKVLTWVRATTADNFPIKNLADLEIPVPPLVEQRRIADALDLVDGLRGSRKSSLALLEELKESVCAKSLIPDAEDPSAWREVRLGELIRGNPQNGLYKPMSSYGEGVPVIRIDSFRAGEMVACDRLKRLSVSADEVESYGVKVGDIIVNRVNSIDHLGKSVLIEDFDEPVVFESNMMRISIDEKLVNPAFLAGFLQLKEARSQIVGMAKQSINQASINQSDVRSISVILPPRGVQDEVSDSFSKLNSMRDCFREHLARLDELFASVQQRAFRGDLWESPAA